MQVPGWAREIVGDVPSELVLLPAQAYRKWALLQHNHSQEALTAQGFVELWRSPDPYSPQVALIARRIVLLQENRERWQSAVRKLEQLWQVDPEPHWLEQWITPWNAYRLRQWLAPNPEILSAMWEVAQCRFGYVCSWRHLIEAFRYDIFTQREAEDTLTSNIAIAGKELLGRIAHGYNSASGASRQT